MSALSIQIPHARPITASRLPNLRNNRCCGFANASNTSCPSSQVQPSERKADKIRRELVISTPDESAKLNALVFSPGWLSKFQSRHRLTSKCVHGETASVNRAAVEKARAALQELARGYERHSVFDIDDTAFSSSEFRRRRPS
uniref:AlNc14C152G7555 protein n=1 Tax=Albugo laibachii Nc14 TaxID=890382 RepID=F0WM52_9STRA|nr:AlNc14C152G7555 [Albugo laibachii Nc14]|eukprot:CCA22380.1 AlNc14C152G7555 [Albugo laibachii Nc14]